MQSNGSPLAQVAALLDAGLFNDALDLATARRAELERVDRDLYRGFSAEVQLNIGSLALAEATASELVQRAVSRPEVVVTAHKVLGEVRAYELNYGESLKHYSSARNLAKELRDSNVEAAVELSFLNRFWGVLPLESSLTGFADVKRAVARSARPSHFAELRLCAARVEARRGSRIEASRHLLAAMDFLDGSPNARILALAHLNRCVLYILDGDLERALESADAALRSADRSGHFRTRVAALIDTAHILHLQGKYDEAQRSLSVALK